MRLQKKKKNKRLDRRKSKRKVSSSDLSDNMSYFNQEEECSIDKELIFSPLRSNFELRS
jgi:hypothetical protein